MSLVPRRLRKDPILEAVAEFRFKPSDALSASAILPGLLYPQVRAQFPTLKPLPVTQLPAQVRSLDTNLKYAPMYHLIGDRRILIIGDRSLAVSVEAPYPGWSDFKDLITSVWSLTRDSGVIGEVERVSIKYTNLLEAPLNSDHFALTNIRVTLGDTLLSVEPGQLQTEIKSGSHVTLVNLMLQGTASNSKDGTTRDGAVLIVDSILMGPFADFWERTSEYLEQVHTTEKSTFFKLLSDETLKRYEPEY